MFSRSTTSILLVLLLVTPGGGEMFQWFLPEQSLDVPPCTISHDFCDDAECNVIDELHFDPDEISADNNVTTNTTAIRNAGVGFYRYVVDRTQAHQSYLCACNFEGTYAISNGYGTVVAESLCSILPYTFELPKNETRSCSELGVSDCFDHCNDVVFSAFKERLDLPDRGGGAYGVSGIVMEDEGDPCECRFGNATVVGCSGGTATRCGRWLWMMTVAAGVVAASLEIFLL